MKSKLFFLGIMFSMCNVLAQPTIEWQKSLGGTGGDIGRSVRQTSDGGYIVAGHTGSSNGDVSTSYGGRDVWVVKLNSLGNIQWEKSIGGSGDEEAHAIQQTADGGYIIVGMSDSNNFFGANIGGDDILIVKLDSNGNTLWGKKYGTIGTDRGHSIRQIADGGYIASGFRANGGIWVARLDANGDIANTWSNTTFGGAQAWWAEQTSDGGFIVTGHFGLTPDLIVIKVDPTSAVEWQYTYGGASADYGRSVKQTPDGGYIVTGMTQSSDGDVANNYGNQDFWVLKLDASGSLEWEKNYGGTQNDFATEIQLTSDGGYVVVGQTNSDDIDVSGNPGSFVFDYWVIKLNGTGQLQWQTCLGGSSNDFGNAIQQTTNGGYIIVGRSISNNIDVSGNHGNYDFWVVKLESETLGIDSNFKDGAISVYPNPAKSKIYIQTELNVINLTLYDAVGKLIIAQKSTNTINVEQLNKGLYLLKIETDKGSSSKKIIID